MAFADHPTLHPTNWIRDLKAQVPRKLVRDAWNKALYGAEAPLSDEAIYIDPLAVRETCRTMPGGPRLRRRQSGMVVAGDWDLSRTTFGGNVKVVSCRMRYLDGVDWEQTPLFDSLMGKIAAGERPDECASRDDILNRYESLDRVFEETRRRGRLLTKAELPDFFRREHGGILIHIDRNGAPLRAASGGIHRLAIAQILELPEIPVQIGAVHRDAVKKGLYAPLRRSRMGTGA
ncbi:MULTISPECIES: hypothetical protein [Salipiger]|uniref:hypothetical protein n=1 Tax=Salipiger TaxID=263377 RepID=UPI003511273F